MKMNRKLFVPTLALAIAASTLGGLAIAHAADQNGQTLSARIAEQFGLKESDVQSTIDQFRADKEAEHKAQFEDYLTQAVTDGKITQAQKQLILTKVGELQEARDANRDQWKDLTPAERRSKMKEKMNELKTWAHDNGIELKYLMPFGHPPAGGHGGIHGGPHGQPAA